MIPALKYAFNLLRTKSTEINEPREDYPVYTLYFSDKSKVHLFCTDTTFKTNQVDVKVRREVQLFQRNSITYYDPNGIEIPNLSLVEINNLIPDYPNNNESKLEKLLQQAQQVDHRFKSLNDSLNYLDQVLKYYDGK